MLKPTGLLMNNNLDQNNIIAALVRRLGGSVLLTKEELLNTDGELCFEYTLEGKTIEISVEEHNLL